MLDFKTKRKHYLQQSSKHFKLLSLWAVKRITWIVKCSACKACGVKGMEIRNEGFDMPLLIGHGWPEYPLIINLGTWEWIPDICILLNGINMFQMLDWWLQKDELMLNCFEFTNCWEYACTSHKFTSPTDKKIILAFYVFN